MSTEKDHQNREALRRSAQETCELSKELCENAVKFIAIYDILCLQ